MFYTMMNFQTVLFGVQLLDIKRGLHCLIKMVVIGLFIPSQNSLAIRLMIIHRMPYIMDKWAFAFPSIIMH